MAVSGLSLAIVFIGVIAYAAGGPLQAGPNTLQQNEYERLADILARVYWEDRSTGQGRNLDQIGGRHLVRNAEKQFKGLLNEEEEEDQLTQFLNSASDKRILDAIRRGELSAERFRNGNVIDSSINSAFADTASQPYSPDLNAGRVYDQLLMDQPNRGSPNNVRGDDERIIRNLDQIGGGNIVRNLDQIGGGNIVRNLDQIGGGHLVRNLDQIGGGHLVRHLNQLGDEMLVRNLDPIGGGHLVRTLDPIGGRNIFRSIDQPANIPEKLHSTRNLDQIGGGNILRNLDRIGGGNLVRNLN